METRIRYARAADGVNIAYATIGEGPTVVDASNIWGILHMYRHVAIVRTLYDAVAAAGLRVVLFDSRGMGSSDRSDDYSFDARLRDFEAVCDAAGGDAFFITGLAEGVPKAIAYAARHPDRVLKMVLLNGYTRGVDWYRLVPAMRVSERLQDMAEEDWETYTLAMASAVMQFGDAEQVASMAAAYRSSAAPADAVAYMRANLDVDVTDLLPLVKAPTLVVHFTPTLAGTLPFMREIASKIPDAQFAEVAMGPEYGKLLTEFLLGTTTQVPGERAPGGFRTVLFTDLVGHTEMMSRLGDERGRAVLREHERITREVLAAHGGTEVKTMGDGFMASFASVTKAVECAVALQRAFAERNASLPSPAHGRARPEPGASRSRRGVGGEGLHVRVGINAGEPIEEDGDLFGATVILASRIAAKAEGGDILVADTVRGLCSGKGFLFADRGEFVAKGFEEPVRVYEVSWRE
jgi:class 3 adenylate cyclase/pimeloyl-ACP methyl ester carboxylesterase